VAGLLKLLGELLTVLALFFNSVVGRMFLLIIYVAILIAAWILEVILLPFIVNLFLATSVRRPLIFIAWALIPSPWRHKLRAHGKKMIEWWNERSRRVQLFYYTLLVVFLTFLLLEATEATNVLIILPFPLIVSAFFKRELPYFIVRFIARMGMDRFLFEGGWLLFSSKMRHGVKRWSTKWARNIIGIRMRIRKGVAKLAYIRPLHHS
jgi:hypothetical protein